MKTEKPYRSEHTYVQTVDAKIDDVFPLLCPVEEIKWAPGWNPELVITESGVVEEDCMFNTATNGSKEFWHFMNYDKKEYSFDLLHLTPGVTHRKLAVTLTPISNTKTACQISETLTALSDEGKKSVDKRTKEKYDEFMKHWEMSINYYLKHGKMIEV